MKKVKQRLFSIKAKQICIIIPFVIVIIIMLILFSYDKSKDIIIKSSQNLLETSVSNQVSQINSWIKENLSSFQAIKTTIESINPSDEQLQVILDKYYNYNKNYPEGLYISDKNGNIIKAANSHKVENDVKNSIWFKQGMSRINMEFGSAYKNQDGENIISASSMLINDLDNIKVISVDVSLERISIIINSLIDMDSAKAFLIDKNDNVILAHFDNNLLSTKLDKSNEDVFLSNIAKKIEQEDYNTCEIDGYMTAFGEIKDTNWLVVSYVPKNIILSELLELRTDMIIISIISIIILIILIERIIHIVIKPIRNLTKVITTMTNGDFTLDIKSKGNDEISIMSQSLKNFISQMCLMINNINNISNKLNKQALDSKIISQQMYDASKFQAGSMNNLNITVDELSTSITAIADSANTLTNVVSNTKQNSKNVNDKMCETVVVSEEGRKAMEKVSSAMINIKQSINEVQIAVNKVGSSSNEITNIVNLIGSIAEETNLLSLNASIEAARAGEAGKGFAVVATEIGKLAQTSSNAVQDITKLINDIIKLVSEAVNQANKSSNNVNESVGLINQSTQIFNNIYSNINKTNVLIQDMFDKVNNVDDIATTVAAISQEQAAGSEEIAVTSQDMVMQSNKISENSKKVAQDAEQLASTSEELNKQIHIFKI